MIAVEEIEIIAEPSRGACSSAHSTAFIEPAPGMFWTMTRGAPGRCFVNCGASLRAVMSKTPPGAKPTTNLIVCPA